MGHQTNALFLTQWLLLFPCSTRVQTRGLLWAESACPRHDCVGLLDATIGQSWLPIPTFWRILWHLLPTCSTTQPGVTAQHNAHRIRRPRHISELSSNALKSGRWQKGGDENINMLMAAGRCWCLLLSGVCSDVIHHCLNLTRPLVALSYFQVSWEANEGCSVEFIHWLHRVQAHKQIKTFFVISLKCISIQSPLTTLNDRLWPTGDSSIYIYPYSVVHNGGIQLWFQLQ